jgi:hypothetical protein
VVATPWRKCSFKLTDQDKAEFERQANNHSFFMNIREQINKYIASQPEPKHSDMQELHRFILQVLPGSKLWFPDGKTAKLKLFPTPILDMDFIQ